MIDIRTAMRTRRELTTVFARPFRFGDDFKPAAIAWPSGSAIRSARIPPYPSVAASARREIVKVLVLPYRERHDADLAATVAPTAGTVLLLPGMSRNDAQTSGLCAELARGGYRSFGWGLGDRPRPDAPADGRSGRRD